MITIYDTIITLFFFRVLCSKNIQNGYNYIDVFEQFEYLCKSRYTAFN